MTTMEEINNKYATESQDAGIWGLDKRIPITFIFVVVIQTVTITWGAATLASDVKNYGERIVKLERDFSNFVEKADDKYELSAVHIPKEQRFNSMVMALRSEIANLRNRINNLEQRK